MRPPIRGKSSRRTVGQPRPRPTVRSPKPRLRVMRGKRR